jgi:hypothetical protein
MHIAYQINNFLKEYRHFSHFQITVVSGIMDQLGNLVQTQLLGTFTKDKKHRINNVGFPAAIGTHNRREALQRMRWLGKFKSWDSCKRACARFYTYLVERSNTLRTSIRLEVVKNHLGDNKPRLCIFLRRGIHCGLQALPRSRYEMNLDFRFYSIDLVGKHAWLSFICWALQSKFSLFLANSNSFAHVKLKFADFNG